MSRNFILRFLSPPPKVGRSLQIICALSTSVFFTGRVAGGVLGGDYHKDDLVSVLPRGNEVLASTREGIYRSARTVHRWERLEVPGNLPLGGTFVAEPEDAANIYYYYLYDPMIPKPLSPHCLDSGIFRSRDDGKTWTLVDRETHVRSVLVLRDGTVGTLQWVPDEADTRKRRVWPIIRCSHDNGATWSDITHNADSRVYKLIVDPDNDSLIALLDLSAGFLPGLLRADDERYIWKERSVPPPSRVPPTDALYFGRDYYRATELFLCRATLSNYFEKPFQNPIPIPDQVSIPAFDVAPEQPEYQFDHFGPKVIRVQLTFDPGSDQAIQMVDDERGEAFWSAKVIDPAGRRKTLQNVGPQATPATVPSTTPAPNRFTVSRLHPYRRAIDLAPLVDFTAPGKYRIQLKYDNWPDYRDESDQTWHGSFSGEVFTVVIRK